MLVKDKARVIAINDGSSGCPHNYHMKPSDRDKIVGAGMAIYIDDKFDVFAEKLLDGFPGSVVRISDMSSISFTGADGTNNWHFWLDLQNILALQNELAHILIQKFPELKEHIIANKMKADQKIKTLMVQKSKALKGLSELVLISDSLEHFATDIDSGVKITRLYKKTNGSLQYITRLDKILTSQTEQCVLLDIEQDEKLFTKYGKKIVKLDSENWALPEKKHSHQIVFCWERAFHPR